MTEQHDSIQLQPSPKLQARTQFILHWLAQSSSHLPVQIASVNSRTIERSTTSFPVHLVVSAEDYDDSEIIQQPFSIEYRFGPIARRSFEQARQSYYQFHANIQCAREFCQGLHLGVYSPEGPDWNAAALSSEASLIGRYVMRIYKTRQSRSLCPPDSDADKYRDFTSLARDILHDLNQKGSLR